jgi:hypothetical protein
LLHDFIIEDIRRPGSPSFPFYMQVELRFEAAARERPIVPVVPFTFFNAHSMAEEVRYYTFDVAAGPSASVLVSEYAIKEHLRFVSFGLHTHGAFSRIWVVRGSAADLGNITRLEHWISGFWAALHSQT